MLQLLQFEIEALPFHQFAVGTLFDNPVPVQHQNPARGSGRRE
jgi:hypothetical protein